MGKDKTVQMWKGKRRFTYRDTRKGVYRYDRKTGKETYIWLGDRKKKRH